MSRLLRYARNDGHCEERSDEAIQRNYMYRPKSKPARIGANRQMQMAEKRANMPSIVKRKALRIAKLSACAALVGGIVFSALTYGPALTDKIFVAVKSSNKLPSAFRITGCSLPVQASLTRAIDLMVKADSSSFNRAGILKAAAAIPEIETVNVGKISGASKDKTTLISVTERRPVAIVHNGGMFLVDKMGICFSPIPGQFYDLPLLSFGKVTPGDTVDLERFNKIKKSARNIDKAFYKEISEIDLSGSSEVNILLSSSDAEYKISTKDIETGLIRVKALKERLTNETGKTKIDLRYKNLAFITTH